MNQSTSSESLIAPFIDAPEVIVSPELAWSLSSVSTSASLDALAPLESAPGEEEDWPDESVSEELSLLELEDEPPEETALAPTLGSRGSESSMSSTESPSSS